MKTLLAFILISASNLVWACGPYYPYGESVRFSLFQPRVFPIEGLDGFQYSTHGFMPDDAAVRAGENLNIVLWNKRCGLSLKPELIYEAVYGDAENAFNDYLEERKDQAAIDYLKFAKHCSDFNLYFEDPWERNEHTSVPKRSQLIKKALKKAGTKDPDLSQRYAFLAIRMAFYNQDAKTIATTYTRYFEPRQEKNIIDYWSMYFRALTEADSVKRSFYAAQVFANAPDKRFMIHTHFNRDINIQNVLALASTNDEKAAVWALAGIRNRGKAIESIRNIRLLQPSSPLLSLLLTREINKLEDWILTPHYSDFDPSMEGNNYWEESYVPYNKQRIVQDRTYANRLLDIVKGTDFSKTENPALWKSAAIYLHFLTTDYAGSMELIRKYEQANTGRKAEQEQVDQFKALCLVAQQPKDSAFIPDEVKPILLREHGKKNNRLLFALARELEFKGNTTDAAILLSKFTDREYDEWGEYEEMTEQYWKSRNGFQTLYFDFYYDYFLYLDAEYTPAQMKELIATVQQAKIHDVYDRWKYAGMKKELPRLYDLLGTKYIRKDQLRNALNAFEKVSDTLWTSKQYAYATYLNADPFYTNMYNEHTLVEADKKVRYNKESITRKLIEYLGKAENAEAEHRDYYYFLVANCHLNMSYYGNSWMMKRYYSSQAVLKTGLEDDDDYYNCDAAKKYYLKAKSVSKSKKFRALCLRMAGRCEKYRLIHEIETSDAYLDSDEYERRLMANKYYKQIKTDYPDDYDELISNCYSFERYFETYKDTD